MGKHWLYPVSQVPQPADVTSLEALRDNLKLRWILLALLPRNREMGHDPTSPTHQAHPSLLQVPVCFAWHFVPWCT